MGFKDVSGLGAREERRGVLFVVATPLGNLEDITLRALRVLKEVSRIAAEGVSHTRGLCRHYGIKTRITAYHQHNQRTQGPVLLRQLKCGDDIALVTDAGTPGISDPGTYLIRLAVEEGIRITPVPGPSAVTCALSVSGFDTSGFVFVGFLSNRRGRRRKELSQLCQEGRSLVFFEAPHRIREMVSDLYEMFGDRQGVIVREMTKLFEEIRRGPLSVLLKGLASERVKGEYTVIVAGQQGRLEHENLGLDTDGTITRLLADGSQSVKSVAEQVAKERHLVFRQVYRECLALKRKLEKTTCHGSGEET